MRWRANWLWLLRDLWTNWVSVRKSGGLSLAETTGRQAKLSTWNGKYGARKAAFANLWFGVQPLISVENHRSIWISRFLNSFFDYNSKEEVVKDDLVLLHSHQVTLLTFASKSFTLTWHNHFVNRWTFYYIQQAFVIFNSPTNSVLAWPYLSRQITEKMALRSMHFIQWITVYFSFFCISFSFAAVLYFGVVLASRTSRLITPFTATRCFDDRLESV